MIITPLFKKLNLKQQIEIVILNHPAEFETELNAIKHCTSVQTNIDNIGEIEFVLVFVKTQDDINTFIPLISERLKGDGIVWCAYPKKTSKKHKSEINRDNGWTIFGNIGFEGVRQVAIDADWSALRFRKVEYIKKMNRRTDYAMTEKGKQMTKDANHK